MRWQACWRGVQEEHARPGRHRLYYMQKIILGSRSCRRTGLGYRRSVLAKCGALEMLDAVRVGPAERLTAASAQLMAVLSLP